MYYQINFLDKEDEEKSFYADFDDETQTLIDELLEEGRSIVSVVECHPVTNQFRIENDAI
jgi:hypothetical protein